MKQSAKAAAVAAALAAAMAAPAPAWAQSETAHTETPTTEPATTDESEDAAECAAVTAVVPVPSASDTELPTSQGTGIFNGVVQPVAADESLAGGMEPIFIPYKARGQGESAEVYSSTLTDGYARLTQIAHRVVSQCPDTKLFLLGQGQAAHLVSFLAQEIGNGNSPIPDSSVAFVGTISDVTRGEGQTLFPGAPGQSAPLSWEGDRSSNGPTLGGQKSTSTSSARPSSSASLGGSERSSSRPSSSASLGDTGDSSSSSRSSAPRASGGSSSDEPQTQDTSVKLYADLARMPDGAGLNHDSQRIEDFGSLTGRVAQFCAGGDLSCSAPANAALGRAAVSIMENADTDFTKDPLGAANMTSQALTATAASGVARSAGQDWEGDTLDTLAPTGDHSVSERIEEAAAPRIRPAPTAGGGNDDPTTATEDSVQALTRAGSIGINAVSQVAGDVLDEDTIGSLLAAGVTGGATSPELTTTLQAKAGASALKLISPKSLGSRAVKVFEAMTNGITDNAELPELIAAARTWDRLATQDGYSSVPIASTGESATEVLTDWLAASVRDAQTAAAAGGEDGGEDSPDNQPGDTSPSESPASSSAAAPATDTASSSVAATTRNDAPNARPAPAAPAGPRPTDPLVRTDDGRVQAAGPVPQADAYTLTTVAEEASNYGADPQSVADASKGLITKNTDFTAAQQLGMLSDPAYPADNALKALAVSGGMVPVSHGKDW